VSQSLLEDALGGDGKKKSLKLKDEVAKRLPKASKPGNWDSDVVGGESVVEGGAIMRALSN
jgi:SAGA-associated factor 73